jgi:hypothetical protein
VARPEYEAALDVSRGMSNKPMNIGKKKGNGKKRKKKRKSK